MSFIHQVEPYISEGEADALAAYLRSGGWLTEFTHTQAFEEAISAFLGVRHCIAVPNGTVALYLGLVAAGIGPGDKVLVPDYTMIASPNAVRWTGADVVLVDIEPSTMCLDLDAIPMDSDVRAMMYVSINGRSGDMLAVQRFCRQHGLLLFEDACQSFGSMSEGQHLGTLGKAGCFSFSPHKIITTGQGGALVTDDEQLFIRAKRLKDFHRTAPATDWHDGMGYNFKFTDIQAVIGNEQIRTITWRIQRKKQIYADYVDRLREVNEVAFLPADPEDVCPWFVDVLLPTTTVRDTLRTHLKAAGIATRPFYPPIHHQPMYADEGGTFPVAESMASRGLWLPSSLGLTGQDIDRVCLAVRDFFGAHGS